MIPASSILGMVLQYFVLPGWVKKLGALQVYRWTTILWPLTFAMLPTTHGSGYSAFGFVLFFRVLLYRVAELAFP